MFRGKKKKGLFLVKVKRFVGRHIPGPTTAMATYIIFDIHNNIYISVQNTYKTGSIAVGSNMEVCHFSMYL